MVAADGTFQKMMSDVPYDISLDDGSTEIEIFVGKDLKFLCRPLSQSSRYSINITRVPWNRQEVR